VAYGHVLPLVPLAQACVAQGYETLLATGETMVGRMPVETIAGLPDWSLSEVETETSRRHPELAKIPAEEGYRFAVELFADVTAEGFITALGPVLGDFAPDLVVYEVMSVGAALVASRLGIPCVCVGVLQRSFFTDLLHRTVVERHGQEDSATLVPSAYLDLFPASMRSVAGDPPITESLRPVPASTLDAPLPDWLLGPSDRKRVYLTLGTVAYGATHAFEAALDVLDEHDVDVLVAVGPKGNPSALRPRGGRVHVETLVNQAAVLSHIDAVVHHGGSGTMLSTMLTGLPQVVMPLGADQFQNAALLEKTGAGCSVPGDSCISASQGHRRSPDKSEDVERSGSNGRRDQGNAVARHGCSSPAEGNGGCIEVVLRVHPLVDRRNRCSVFRVGLGEKGVANIFAKVGLAPSEDK
jgi:UDP:flavonoid glycosyltransferase YjiC (YdhE family)